MYQKDNCQRKDEGSTYTKIVESNLLESRDIPHLLKEKGQINQLEKRMEQILE